MDSALIAQDWMVVRHTMWNYVGLLRSEKRLHRAGRILSELQVEIEDFYRRGTMSDELLGLRNGVQTALAIHRAASENRVSRGATTGRTRCQLMPGNRDSGDWTDSIESRSASSESLTDTACPDAFPDTCYSPVVMSVLYLDFAAPTGTPGRRSLPGPGPTSCLRIRGGPASSSWRRRRSPTRSRSTSQQAPSHSLETADYLAKAKETRDVAIYLLRVPEDRMDIGRQTPAAGRSSSRDQELSVRVTHAEKEAQERARQKKEAAAAARKNARAKAGAAEKAGAPGAAAGKPKAAAKAAAKPKKPAAPVKKGPAPKKKKAAAKTAPRGRKG